MPRRTFGSRNVDSQMGQTIGDCDCVDVDVDVRTDDDDTDTDDDPITSTDNDDADADNADADDNADTDDDVLSARSGPGFSAASLHGRPGGVLPAVAQKSLVWMAFGVVMAVVVVRVVVVRVGVAVVEVVDDLLDRAVGVRASGDDFFVSDSSSGVVVRRLLLLVVVIGVIGVVGVVVGVGVAVVVVELARAAGESVRWRSDRRWMRAGGGGTGGTGGGASDAGCCGCCLGGDARWCVRWIRGDFGMGGKDRRREFRRNMHHRVQGGARTHTHTHTSRSHL